MSNNPPYMEIIVRKYPDARVYTTIPTNYSYSDLVWETTPIPEQELLDSYLQLAKDYYKLEVNSSREKFLLTGFWFQGYLYDCDEISRTNATGAAAGLLLGEIIPPDFTWRDKNNQNHPFDSERLRVFALQMLRWVTYVYQISWYIKEQIQAATTAEDIRNIPIEAYWPDNNFDGSKPAPGDPLPPL